MVNWGSLFLFLLLLKPCTAGVPITATMARGFKASEMDFINSHGMFLTSNNSNFAFGFQPTNKDPALFLLAIVHLGTFKPVWAANRGSPVRTSDAFVFDNHGNVRLQTAEHLVWSPNTNGKAVSFVRLLDSGNLVMFGGDDNATVWESFKHPTDTLLPTQEFIDGMKLSTELGSRNLSYFLQIKSGAVQLFVNFSTPQPYWSIGKDARTVINNYGGRITRAVIEGSSWRFYDHNNEFLLQLIISEDSGSNSTWIAVLGSDGFLSFYSLGGDSTSVASRTKIPGDSCEAPGSCGAYYVCSSNTCQCPLGMLSRDCQPGFSSDPCHESAASTEMVYVGDSLNYFALDYVFPTNATDLIGCKASCSGKCSCLAMFFNNDTRSCYMFGNVGSFKHDSSSKYDAFVKVLKTNAVRGGRYGYKHSSFAVIISIVASTFLISMIYGGNRIYMKKRKMKMGNQESLSEDSEGDNFLESLSGAPVRYSFKDLETATNNFSVKLGQGGFGSVYQGILSDGTHIAVKKLEGVGQGKKEFRAEVGIIGSIHHLHLVKLKGFCTEKAHRLLAYEFMAKGSLDKWIFGRKEHTVALDWEARLNIAIGTAKGLAYLHEDCSVKIVHCDIKPENVLLDDQFQAKVSDFGLAKLMTREQSHVFTTLRGTRGYLAPEWITNYAISEKSDVYSYGMMLLEIIGGRKNYDPRESSEKSHFPSFAFRMMQEGKLSEVVDSSLKYDPNDESVCRAIKLALWCIQEDMSLRPCMGKVAQMLEGTCPVPEPPLTPLMGSHLFASFFKSSSGGTATWNSSGPSDCSSRTNASAVRLSGPR